MSVLINWLMSLGNFSARRLRWSKLILTTLWLIVLMLNSGHLKLGWTVSLHSQKLIVHKIIVGSLKATCSLDPIPTWLVKQSVDVLTPVITLMLNWSFRKGRYLTVGKALLPFLECLKRLALIIFLTTLDLLVIHLLLPKLLNRQWLVTCLLMVEFMRYYHLWISRPIALSVQLRLLW